MICALPCTLAWSDRHRLSRSCILSCNCLPKSAIQQDPDKVPNHPFKSLPVPSSTSLLGSAVILIVRITRSMTICFDLVATVFQFREANIHANRQAFRAPSTNLSRSLSALHDLKWAGQFGYQPQLRPTSRAIATNWTTLVSYSLYRDVCYRKGTGSIAAQPCDSDLVFETLRLPSFQSYALLMITVVRLSELWVSHRLPAENYRILVLHYSSRVAARAV